MSKSRAKGTDFENDVVEYLRGNGFPKAKRLPFASPLGDIKGTPIVLEAKNQKTMKLPEWLTQAAKSGAKAGFIPAVVHKRARKNVSKSYVTMELDEFTKLLQAVAETRPIMWTED
jgi:Holliday junction resolvase